MVEPLADGVHTFHTPGFKFMGLFQLGARMTAVQLSDGSLVLHSPIPIDASLKDAVDALGRVRWVVAPSLYHHLFAQPAAALWPEARLLCPEALKKKRKDLASAGDLASPPDDWQGVLDVIPLAGSMLGESVLFHKPTGTLVAADLVANFKAMDHAITRAYLKAGGVYGRPGWNRLLRWVYTDRAAARRSLEAILDLPLFRVIVAHGDPILEAPKETLREGLCFLFEGT